MAAISKNPFDICSWLVKVIESCKTSEQAEGAVRLVWSLYRMTKGNNDPFLAKAVSLTLEGSYSKLNELNDKERAFRISEREEVHRN